MTKESTILRAYALLSQGKYEDAEAMLRSAPEVLNTPSGADLFARLRFEQGSDEEAHAIWEKIHQAFPDFEPATKALDAFANPSPDDEEPEAEPGGQARRCRIAAIAAIAIGAMASILASIKGCHPQTPNSQLASRVITNTVVQVETQVVDRPVTNFVDKVRTEFIDRVVTNVVEKIVEVPSRLALTNTIERIVSVTNQITVVVTNRVDLPLVVISAKTNSTERTNSVSAVESRLPKRIVLSTPYIVNDGDTVGGLAAKYKFRIPDFVVYNPNLDINLIRVGQTIQLPGDVKVEDSP